MTVTGSWIISALALALASASLAWQIATFELSASRVKTMFPVVALGLDGAIVMPVAGGWEAALREQQAGAAMSTM